MKTKSASRTAFFNLRVVVALSVFTVAVFLALFATANPPALARKSARDMDAQMRRPSEISLAPSGGVHEAWVARYNGPGNDFDAAEAIAVDNSGNVYVTGRSSDPDFSTHYATVKSNSAGQQQWIARYYGPRNYQDAPYSAAAAVRMLLWNAALYDCILDPERMAVVASKDHAGPLVSAMLTRLRNP